jgi:long-chain fatty acid transport protein
MTAGVNDPSAVYYNPAALGEIEGNNILLSGGYLNVIGSVENSGRTSRNKRDDNFFGTVFANYHVPGTDLTLGIGGYAPFGLATTYEEDFTRFAAQKTQLKTLYITPALSWHPLETLSIGAGLSFVHSSALLSRAVCLDPFTGCATPGGILEGRVRLTDTDNTFTYNVGVLIKPTRTIKLGFSYRGRADLEFDSAEVKLGGAFSPSRVNAKIAPVPLPPVINVGVFWQITPKWSSELVYEYTRWREFKALKAQFSPVPTFFGMDVPGFNLPQLWKDGHTVRFGNSYRVANNLELRGGIAAENTPIPNRTLNPAIPGADILTLNAGIGYRWERFIFDIGYQATFYKTRKVSNNELEGLPATGIPFVGAPGKDKYETFINFVSVSIGYRF